MVDSLRGTSRKNRHRVALTISILAAAAVLVAAVWLSRADPSLRGGPETPPPARRPAAEPLLAVAPADLPAAVRDRYRPRPDRRLLAAVSEVQRLRTGAAPEPAKAEFRDGRWRILSGRDEVGVLSEFPSFEEATSLLAHWVGRVPPASVAPAAGSAGASSDGLEKAL